MSGPVVVISYYCPDCGAPVRRRERRSDGNPFLGCTRYPSCRWTAPYDAREQALAQALAEARDEAADLERELHDARVQLALADDDGPVTKKQIRELVSWGHPDRWPSGHVPAHELGKRLVALLSRARQTA